MRFAAKVDANHAEIIEAYEREYCQVRDCSKFGGGFPDLLIAVPTRRGRVLDLAEAKTDDGTPTKAQHTFHRDFYPFTIVRNIDEVARHVNALRERFK